MGGIGNQLFQYALGRHLAIKNNTELLLDISFYEITDSRKFKLNHFNTKFSIAKVTDIPHLKSNEVLNKIQKIYYFITDKKLKIYDEKFFSFNQNIASVKNNSYLFGYWQSEKYFSVIRDILINELRPIINTKPNLLHTVSLINQSFSVSLHVRRGDYENNKTHPLISIDYYFSAIELLQSKTNKDLTVFIFSDDLDWCKNNLKFTNECYFVSENEDYEDLYLITLCENHIIANSTFSWWGAWLSQHENKTVIAPKQWFQSEKKIPTEDLLPKTWIKI
jgi:hypothetical protein